MRKLSIFYCLLTICSIAQGANEIRAFAPGVTTAFTVVREIDGDVWYVTGQVFEAWGTGARTAADYDIALVDKSGGMFVGDMDTNIGAGQYYAVTHQQAGGAPADTDPAIWQEYGDWSGTVWIPSTITAGDVWEEAVSDHTGEATFGGEVGGLDPNITLILADSNELQTDWTDGGRLDLLIDAIKLVTDKIPMITTTVSDANDANSFTLAAGEDANDAYWGNTIEVQDADDDHWESRMIIDWTAGRVVVVDYPFSFTPAVGDVAVIWTFYTPGLLFERMLIPDLPEYVEVDRTAAGGGGTTTLDIHGDDP